MGRMAFERITVDPERMDGVPCIRDLRVTVSMVLGQLAAGRKLLLDDYPYLEPEDVRPSSRTPPLPSLTSGKCR
jgi:uncharacterized protein (DUF433 family)